MYQIDFSYKNIKKRKLYNCYKDAIIDYFKMFILNYDYVIVIDLKSKKIKRWYG